MPSSAKLFSSSRPLRRRLSASPLTCALFAIVGFLLGAAISPSNPLYRRPCASSKPLSVSVQWNSPNLVNPNDQIRITERPKVTGFVGIQTGFGSVGRRRSLRKTWFPSNHDALRRLEEATGLAFRFVIGKTEDRSRMMALQKEVEEFDDFMLLDIQEEYSKLPYKTLAFFKAAYALFDAKFYVKADDDIYLRPDRLSLLLAKPRNHPQTYLGCMKKGPVFTDPKLKWYEPLSYLLGSDYFLHAYGPIYALSAEVVASLVVLKNDSFRMFSNEDVTIGAWILAMNVNHENNHALCSRECTPTSIAVWDIPACSGLCHPEEKMLELHRSKSCSGNPTVVSHV